GLEMDRGNLLRAHAPVGRYLPGSARCSADAVAGRQTSPIAAGHNRLHRVAGWLSDPEAGAGVARGWTFPLWHWRSRAIRGGRLGAKQTCPRLPADARLARVR